MRVCPFPKSLHLRLLLCLALLAGSAGTQAAGQDDDWALFGRVLALVQTVTSAAASSDDPRAAERSIGGMLAGENRQANRLAAELMDEAFADMPAQYKGSMLALARDMATIARREAARRPAASDASAALQARRDLAAMSLPGPAALEVRGDPEDHLEGPRKNKSSSAALIRTVTSA